MEEKYIVEIDFDAASIEWRRNKKHQANGIFTYICGISTKNGSPCQRPESHRRFHKTESDKKYK